MGKEQPEHRELSGSYSPQPRPESQTQAAQPLALTSAAPRPSTSTKVAAFALSILFVFALATVAYLLLKPTSQPTATTNDSAQRENNNNDPKDTITKQVREAIKNPTPLQSFSYEGWKSYPGDVEVIYDGIKYPPQGQLEIFGDVTFSFPAYWRYVEGTDMRGLSSRPWFLGEADQNREPNATLTFGWWPTDNTNGFENAVLSRLQDINFPSSEPDARYTHKLREIGINSHGKMMAIVDYSYHHESSYAGGISYNGVLGIVDDVRSTYPSQNKISLASTRSSLAADVYQGAKETLSIISCTYEKGSEGHINECIGIIKSYNNPATDT